LPFKPVEVGAAKSAYIARQIVEATNADEYTVLRPNGQVLLDADYVLSTVGGLYGRVDPERAVRMLKKYLMPLEVEQVKADS
jgi:hypothetical protein